MSEEKHLLSSYLNIFVERASPLLPAKKCRISEAAMTEVKRAMRDYGTEVLDSYLSPRSQAMYLGQAENFVRWLEYEFDPGRRVNPYPLRKKQEDRVKS